MGTNQGAIVSFSVHTDRAAELECLSVKDKRVLLSTHKEQHPSDSEDFDDIGESSDDEAEGMEDVPYIRRKKDRAPPVPAPAPAPGPAPPSLGPNQVVVDKGVLENLQRQVDTMSQVLTQLKEGVNVNPSNLPQPPPPPPAPAPGAAPLPTEENPFANVRVEKGDFRCQICQRKCGNTTRLKRHMRTHTGDQKEKYTCKKCNKKLNTKKTYDDHISSCGVDKTHTCTTMKPSDVPGEADYPCGKKFATRALLLGHQATHNKLNKRCPCGKVCNTIKTYNDHWRHCSKNPAKIGPFPCPVPGCSRGRDKPFPRYRNMSFHLKKDHGYDPKHIPAPPPAPRAPTPDLPVDPELIDLDNNENNNNNNNNNEPQE